LPDVLTPVTLTQSPFFMYCIVVGGFPELFVRLTLAEPSEIPTIVTSKYEGEFSLERFPHRFGGSAPYAVIVTVIAVPSWALDCEILTLPPVLFARSASARPPFICAVTVPDCTACYGDH